MSHTSSPSRTARVGGTAGKGFLIRLTVISTLGGLLFGYDTGVISGALLYMRDDLAMTTAQEAWVVSSLLFPGAAFGALLGGRIADWLGRKNSLIVCAVIFLVGALGCALAPNVALMVAARIILGFGVGAAAVACPLYLAEMAPAERRGRMVTINELMIVTGQMLAFAINALLAVTIEDAHVWRIMLGVAAIPAVVLLIGMFLLPESPRWFGARGRVDEARQVLTLSRSPEQVEVEVADIVATAKAEGDSRKHAWHALRDNRWMRRLLYIGFGLAAVQQATGINTVNYYAPSILTASGLGEQAALIATIGVGVTSVVMTIVGIWLLGFVPRRVMLMIGFGGVVGSQLLLAFLFTLPESDATSYTILAGMMLFVAFVQAFIGTGVWLMLSEIFPLAIRGLAMGLAVFVLWTVNAFISFVFPQIVEAIGSTPTFLVFAAINALSFFFVWRAVPETKGRSLERLEEDFRTQAIRTVPRRERLGA
ncbi:MULTISPECIES: sugar porter family MFS transporter [Microbacterium]|uniref:Major myo-inositol transporter IolT n=1 Tax=Microbacterium trichothecenolyticum TaxID=69370 RepID=A0A0M2H2Y6_MICTR|nr:MULTISPECIES: sugar porter family MFS transporter [Microbacterium]KJL40633.1 Major myo-inositol transporter IolT [Microbacterium trichothecenolyticum]MDR7188515.1 major inositol transporter-like SP family MFS transporter [Microbacterium sp. BE35]